MTRRAMSTKARLALLSGAATNRRERSIELQPADRARLLLEGRRARCGNVAATARNFEICAQFAGLSQVRDHEFGIHDLDVVVADDVTGCHGPRALLHQRKISLIAAVHLDRDGFQIQKNVDDIFLHAFDTRVFVQHTFDLGLDDRGARHRRQQNAPQRIAERMPEPSLEGFYRDSRTVQSERLHLDGSGPQKFRGWFLHLG
jgi:hypothetical protein